MSAALPSYGDDRHSTLAEDIHNLARECRNRPLGWVPARAAGFSDAEIAEWGIDNIAAGLVGGGRPKRGSCGCHVMCEACEGRL